MIDLCQLSQKKILGSYSPRIWSDLDIKMKQKQRERSIRRVNFNQTLNVIKFQSTSSEMNSEITVSLTHLKTNVVPDGQTVTSTTSLEQKGWPRTAQWTSWQLLFEVTNQVLDLIHVKISLNSESLNFLANPVISFKHTGKGVDEQSHGQYNAQLYIFKKLIQCAF